VFLKSSSLAHSYLSLESPPIAVAEMPPRAIPGMPNPSYTWNAHPKLQTEGKVPAQAGKKGRLVSCHGPAQSQDIHWKIQARNFKYVGNKKKFKDLDNDAKKQNKRETSQKLGLDP
jgi:hypothetical protein